MTETIRGTVASVLPTLEPPLEPPFMRIDLDAVRAVVREEVRAALADNAALRKASEQALERLRKYHHGHGFAEDAECIAALEAALAQHSPATLFDTRGSLGEPIV